MSATTVSTRTDVVAVGPLLTNQTTKTPIYDDAFILAAVISPSSPFFKGANSSMNGFTFAVAFAVNEKDNSIPPRVFFAESVWGQMLVDGKIFDYSSGSTSSMLTFRLQSYQLGESQLHTSNYDDYTSLFQYPAFKDIGSVTPYTTAGTLAWDSSNNLAISGSSPPFNQAKITNFQTFAKSPVGAVPDVRTLQAGMRYQLDEQNAAKTRNIRLLPTTSVVPASTNPKNQAFQGLPYRSVAISHSTIVNIPVDQIDMVFLPVKWYNQNCVAYTSVGDDLNFGFYHFCDRWGQLKGTNTPFYTNSCAPQLNNLRGNTNQAQCTLTSNILYYPATTGNTCGSKWRVGVEYQDMTDNLVTAGTSVGPCGDGICGYDANLPGFRCYEATGGDGNTCQADCMGCNASGCADCGTERCTSFTPDVTQCDKDCADQMSCSNCSMPNKIPIWVWVVMAILLVIVLILFVVWNNRNSKQTKIDDEFDLADDGNSFSKDVEEPF